MKFARNVTILLSAIALPTGAIDIITGVSGQANIGVGAAAAVPFDPVLDSQIRFLGAVWFGLGVILLICLSDVQRYGTILQCYFAILILGGIGRVISMIQLGFHEVGIGAMFIMAALVIEILLVPMAWLVFWRASRVSEGGARHE